MSSAAVLAGPDLASQIEDLRQTVAGLRASQLNVSLVAVEPAPWLGQAMSLVATVADADGVPLSGVPVTLFSTWGVLRGGDELIEGTSIALLTGSDGAVRVTLRPAISLDNNEDQDALEAMLQQLDPASVSPSDAQPALLTLAQQYRWEANREFRNAVDAYFAEFGRNIARDPGVRDYTVAWPVIPATVIALTGAAPAAVNTIRVRNWLGAWYQVYQNLAASQIQLNPDLTLVKANAGSADGIVAGAFGRAAIALEGEFGTIGKTVGQRATQQLVGTFLDTGIADLPSDTRVAVSPVLNVLSAPPQTAAGAGLGVVAALGQTHVAAVGAVAGLATKVDSNVFQTAIDAKADLTDFKTLQTTVGAKADVSDLQLVQSSLAAKANSADLTALQATVAAKANLSDLQAVQTALVAKANASDLQALQTTVATKANVADLQTVQASIASKLDAATFATFQKDTAANFATKANSADLQEVQTALAAKANQTDLQAVQATLASKADASAFAAFQKDTSAALAAKVNATDFAVFQKTVNDKLGTIVVRADLDTLAATLNQSIATKADQATVATLQTTIASKANASDVTTLRNLVATKADASALATTQQNLIVLQGRVK